MKINRTELIGLEYVGEKLTDIAQAISAYGGEFYPNEMPIKFSMDLRDLIFCRDQINNIVIMLQDRAEAEGLQPWGAAKEER